jgi:hypothetical protein
MKTTKAVWYDSDGSKTETEVEIKYLAGQWAVTPHVGMVGGLTFFDDARYSVTHIYVGFRIPGPPTSLSVAKMLAKAFSQFEFYSQQDPAFKRDRPAMAELNREIRSFAI